MKPLNRRFPFGHELISIPIREKSEEPTRQEERTTLPVVEGAPRVTLPFRPDPSHAKAPPVVLRRPVRVARGAMPAWFVPYAVISFFVFSVVTFLVLCRIRNPFARAPSPAASVPTAPEERR